MKKVIVPVSEKNNFGKHMNLYHPPLLPMPDIPVIQHYGSFLVKRRFDVHTGVDLYATIGANVYAIEDGEVVKIRWFTGKNAGCDHWNETKCVDIEGYSGIFDYGEMEPEPSLKEGDRVNAGQVIGHVAQVLKKWKGKAMSMLHFAIHSHGWRYLVEDQSKEDMESFFDIQIDPTPLLIQMKAKADLMGLKHSLDETQLWLKNTKL